ncbi:MAG: hypothetical protein QG588_2132 [Candidatus Poribacteria bacterium]|nr:hypothetical protein [Candidatus Poribacteria bacterium]
MIRISVAKEILHDLKMVDGFNESRPHQIMFQPYDGPDTIQLPDFHDSLTRMIYQGYAHSFLPPRAYPHRVLCSIYIDSLDEIRRIGDKYWSLWSLPIAQIYDRSIIIVEFDRAILYLVSGSISYLSRIDFQSMIHQMQSAQSELDGAMPSFGLLGYLAQAIAGPIYLHFVLVDGEPILLGTGPHYTRR